MMLPRIRRPAPGVFSVADQVVSSGSNFLVSVAIGRFGGADELGGFAVALFVWLAIIGLQRALLTEPLIIVEPNLDDPRTLQRVLRAELMLALALSGVVGSIGLVLLLAGSGGIGGPLTALAAVLPLLLGQDLWRALAFGVHRPERALVNDVLFCTVQIVLMLVLIGWGQTAAPAFVLVWGMGAAAGWALGFKQFGTRPVWRPDRELLSRLWPTSRWLLRDFGTLFGARELYLLIVAFFVSSAEFGGLRAAESLLGPSAVILLSGGNVGLPGATRAFRARGAAGLARFSRRIGLLVGAAQWGYCGAMVIAGPYLLVTLYGPEFEQFGYLVALTAARYAISVANFGPSIAIKVAGLAKEMFLARLAVTIVSIPTAIIASAMYGVRGAAIASLVLAGLLVAAMYSVYVPGVVRPKDPALMQPASVRARLLGASNGGIDS